MLSFSIKSILVGVGFVGVACIALNNASPFWQSTTLNLTITLFVFAVLAGIARRSADRIFWLGFAFVGWLYLAISIGPWFETKIEPELATTKVLEYAYPMLRREVPEDDLGLEGPKTKKGGGDSNTIGWPRKNHFKRVGHSLWAVFLALIGGVAAWYLYLSPLPKRKSSKGVQAR